MIIRTPWPAGPAAALAVLLGMAGCASNEQATTGRSGAPDDRLTVVASTDVWASVVRAVAGDAVEIKTIIDDPSADPHSYESSPAEAAEVAAADLVVFNGGGYDEFIEQFLEQATDKPTVEAVGVAGAEPHAGEASGVGEPDAHGHGAGADEHVWYDLPVVAEVAEHTAEELGTLAPEQAPQFTEGAERFRSGIDELSAKLATIADAQAGVQVVMTEPVAEYLIEAAGLADATPPEFLEAVEEETDPPAAAVAATRDLLSQRQVGVLIYNPQTETPVTSQIRAAAESAGIPVVVMTETLPEGTDYHGWMSGQIDALSEALG